jgi:hypothetical protein
MTINKLNIWLIIENTQNNLDSLFPTVPKDAVWGCTKSMSASFLVATAFSYGNIISGSKAALLASVASMVHTIAIGLFMQRFNQLDNKIEGDPNFVYLPHGVSLATFIFSCIIGRQKGMSLCWTIPLTALPYVITQLNCKTEVTTPLFLTIIC